MSESILLLLHTESDGTLPKVALECVTAAAALGSPFTVAVLGAAAQDGVNRLAGCGAARFLTVSGDAFTQPRYSSDATAAEALIRAAGATLVLAPATSRFSRALPGVAARLNGRVDTHLTAVKAEDGTVSVSRWFYRQRIEATLSRTARPWILLLDSGIAQAYAGAPGTAAAEAVAAAAPAVRTEVLRIESPEADQQTIRPDAQVLLVAGAGWTKKQKDGQIHTGRAADLILDFVREGRASLGSSKSLVDMGGEGNAVLPFLTHLHQVGQTGATPRHPKGLATCCHGEEPHVVGWRFIAERRAVNLDANCGWARGKADVLYVADAFEIMEKVNARLRARSTAAGA